MAVVKLRIEIEREVRRLLVANGLPTPAGGVGDAVADLVGKGQLSEKLPDMDEALEVMNRAAHGLEQDGDTIRRALTIGSTLLTKLRSLGVA
jgi:hypothetical protein